MNISCLRVTLNQMMNYNCGAPALLISSARYRTLPTMNVVCTRTACIYHSDWSVFSSRLQNVHVLSAGFL